MKDILTLLESHPQFAATSVKSLLSLSDNSEWIQFSKGDVIYSEYKPSEYAYLVVEGACEGSSVYTLERPCTYGVGAVFGEEGLLKNRLRRRTVIAVTDTLLLRIKGDCVRRVIEDDKAFAARLTRNSNPYRLQYDVDMQQFHSVQTSLTTFVNYTGHALDEILLDDVARYLHEVTEQPVLLIQFREDRVGITLEELERNIQKLCERSAVWNDNTTEVPFLRGEITLGKDERAFARLVPLFDTCSKHFPHILVFFNGQRMSATKHACLDYSNNIYLAIDQSSFDHYAVSELLNSKAKHLKKKIRPILLLDRNEPIIDKAEIEERIQIPIHRAIRLHAEDIILPDLVDDEYERNHRYRKQWRSLAREIGRCRIGLVLSSGAAKGFAHIGVIQVLEEQGIDIDYIVGTSIGSYVAACWAYGYNGKAMEKLALEYHRRWGVWELVDPTFPPRIGVLKGKKVEHRLREILNDTQFNELSMPLQVVATNLDTLDRKIFEDGDIASAVCASCTLPGIVEPRIIDGMRYIDGGITDPLPIDVLAEQGIERIIAVNTVLTTDNARECFLNMRKTPRHGCWRKFLGIINHHVNYFAKGNVFDTLMRSIEASQIRLVKPELKRADILLQPVQCNAVWHEFTRPAKYISLGRQAAEEKLHEIHALTKAPGTQ